MQFLYSVSMMAGPVKLLLCVCAFSAASIIADIGEVRAIRMGSTRLFNYMAATYVVSFIFLLAAIIIAILYIVGLRGGALVSDIGDHPAMLVSVLAAVVVRIGFQGRKKGKDGIEANERMRTQDRA